jgi:hypothetical protein
MFATEANICAEAPGSTSYYGLAQDVSDDSLRNVLARPVLLATGGLTAVPGTVVESAFTSATSFRTAFTPSQWDRMLGYAGIRFSLRIKCVVAKTAFHQGILSLVFQYGVGDDNRFRGNFFPLSVHLPNVRMNLAEETMMELVVPFVFCEEYLRINTVLGVDLQEYGSYALVNLSGCDVAAGQTAPRYSIYLSMEDVEFIGAQPFSTITFNTQAGIPTNVHRTARSDSHAHKPGSQVKEAEAKGLLSDTIGVVADVAGATSRVPGLGAVGGATEWFLRGVAGAAEAFGFSKPIDQTHPSRHVRTSYAGEGQVDMPTIGYSLGAFQSNKLAVDGSTGCTDLDEMAFDYVLTKYSYIYRGNFTSTQSTGDTIYAAPVTPSAFYYRDRDLSVVGATGNQALRTGSTASENAILPSTLCYVGNNFRLWRGNLKFRITFACTKLHGGRVSFNFIPYRQSFAAASPISNTRVVPQTSAVGPTLTGYSTVFDLQDSSVFEFEVPFIYPAPYCPVLEGWIGDVSMQVINPLSVLNSVPTTVRFMVEVCACPGFEFAGPKPSLMSPVPPTGAVAVSFQSGLSELAVRNDTSQQCIGEVFKSVKSVMMLPDYVTTDVGNNTILKWTLDPWFKTNAPPLSTPMSVTTAALYFAARSSRLAEMYSFVRGSTLYSLSKDRTGNFTAVFSFQPSSGGTPAATNGSYYDEALNPLGTTVYPEVLETGRVIVPLYSQYARIPLGIRHTAFGAARSNLNEQTWPVNGTLAVPKLTLRNQTGAAGRVILGRAAADDAIASQFVGPPPTILLNTAATTNPYFLSGNGAEF